MLKRWIPPKVPATLATLDPSSRRQRLAIVAVASLAVALRLHGVWGQSLWEDEVASARVIHAPTLGAALAQIAKTESTPPFWYVLEWSLHRLGMPIVDGRLDR